jgi:hypothetical protein
MFKNNCDENNMLYTTCFKSTYLQIIIIFNFRSTSVSQFFKTHLISHKKNMSDFKNCKKL